jgi:hypothetical protein
MDAIALLRHAIQQTFAEWETLPRIPSTWKIVGVQDNKNDRYTLHQLDWSKDKYDTSLLAYLEIRDGKIWILTDNTEEGIATDLVRFHVPKNQIVLGFYSPALRRDGEFAVA